MKKLWTVLAAISLSASLALTGCAGSGESQSGNRGGAEVNEDEGVVTLKDNEGEDVVITNKQEVPDSFPDDVPMPESIKIVSSITSVDTVTIAIETEIPFEEAVDMYDGYLQEAGYVEAFKSDDPDYYNYSGTKGDEQFVVTLMLDQEDNKTVTGVLVYSKVAG